MQSLESPPFCATCGNLPYTLDNAGQWRCGYCQPVAARPKPETDFFTPAETRAAWPAGWTPPKPSGPAKRAVQQRP